MVQASVDLDDALDLDAIWPTSRREAVLNGVLVVSAILDRLDHGEDPWTATIEGARPLRAVLMTAMLASLGLLPAAMSHAIGSETQRPIAVVVVGGTILPAGALCNC